jgi:hypothetical protein
MATDTNTGIEVKDMAKVWKEGYLKGLETFLQWQQQNEQLVKRAVRQGLSAYHQWLGMYKNWLGKPWDQVQGQSTGVPNQFLALPREILQTSQEWAEPLLKTACENSFDYYETAVAGPARKYTVEINKNILDTLIPSSAIRTEIDDEELKRMKTSDDRYEAKSKVLGESIKHHVKEEGSMLPKAEKLVLDWEELKQKALTRKEAVMGRKSKSTSRSPMQRKRNRSRGRNTQRRHLRKAA